jgi:hypothetical protein
MACHATERPPGQQSLAAFHRRREIARDRRTFIARRVSWSNDNKYIFAAVGEGDSDIVLLDNLVH